MLLPLFAHLLLVMGGLVGGGLADEGQELVAEFRRYYSPERSGSERREAVLTLAGIDTLDAAQALLPVLEDEDYLVRRAAIEVLSAMRAPATAEWLVANVLTDKKQLKHEVLLSGVVEVVGSMGHAPAREVLEALLLDRRTPVRLGALAGLGGLRQAGSVPALAQAVSDPDPAIVVAALDALARMDAAAGEAATPAVLAGLGHVDKSARLAAVRAVQALRLKAGLRPLMQMLDGDADPRVGEDAYDVLRLLTQRQYPEVTAEWIGWWDRAESSFKMPDLEALAAAQRKLAEQGGKYSRGKAAFQGIETRSENIVFVIDVSKSMEEPFGDPERLAATGRQYASLQRLEIVKEELMNTIDGLGESTEFNIVAFASEAESWKKRSVKASILNRNSAKTWVAGLKPRGAGGAAFRARMGFAADEANEGLTNTHLALMTAFGESVEDGGELVTSSRSTVDTIFFLTDGEPTVGKTVDMSEIRQDVRRVNTFRGVQLHVIYVGAYGGKDFRLLAEENNGVFVAVGG